MTDWRKIAFELYRALDDIDTHDDLAKGDEKLYRSLVRREHKTRFRIVPEPLASELYAEFYPKGSNVMERNTK